MWKRAFVFGCRPLHSAAKLSDDAVLAIWVQRYAALLAPPVMLAVTKIIESQPVRLPLMPLLNKGMFATDNTRTTSIIEDSDRNTDAVLSNTTVARACERHRVSSQALNVDNMYRREVPVGNTASCPTASQRSASPFGWGSTALRHAPRLNTRYASTSWVLQDGDLFLQYLLPKGHHNLRKADRRTRF